MNGRDSNFTRRGFVSADFSGLVSAGLLGMSSNGSLAEETRKDSPRSVKKDIIHRRLGKTEIELPIVSMEVMNADNPEVVRASYEIGVRHFDTAAYYQKGRNEKMVSRVIKELGVRDRVVVATNIEAMTLLRKQGKARYIGVSTHARLHEIINEAVSTGVFDVVLTVINFTLANYTELLEAIENAASKGVGVVAMKTQAGSHRRSKPDLGDKYSSSTIATAALKWVLNNKNICTAIPGYTTFEHMNVDFSVASNLEYTSEEKKLLSDQRVKLGMGFCRQCRVCMSTCPRGVEIPSLMRTHMYAVQYSNFIRQEPPLMRSRRDMDSKPADRVRYARLDAPTLSISPGR